MVLFSGKTAGEFGNECLGRRFMAKAKKAKAKEGSAEKKEEKKENGETAAGKGGGRKIKLSFNSLLIMAGAVIVVLAVILAIIFSAKHEEIAADDATLQNETPPLEVAPQPKVLFGDLLTSGDYSIRQITIRGHIGEEQKPVPGRMNAYSDSYFLADDDGNRIELSFIDPSKIVSEPNASLMVYFTPNQTSQLVYTVSGELQWNIGNKPIIYVKSISK
jgi:hypothetical protein